MQRDAFIGCDVHDQEVGLEMTDVSLAEEHERDLLELDRNFRVAGRHALAGADIKRNVGPTPVIDVQFESGESFRLGVGSDARLFAIRQHAHTFNLTFAVLSTDAAVQDALSGQRLDGVQDLCLLVAHRIGMERIRRLHRGQAQQLADVVGDHVAQSSGRLKISATLFHPHRLRDRDLDVVDEAAVPNRFEDAVTEAEDQHVLHGLFAQVVIDAVDLAFAHHAADLSVECARALQVVAERLFIDGPPETVLFAGQSGCTELARDLAEKTRTGSEIKEGVAACLVLLSKLLEQVLEFLEDSGIVELAGQIITALDEPIPGCLVDGFGSERVDVFSDGLAKTFIVERIHCEPDDGEVVCQQIVTFQIVERWDELAPRQVAGCAEDHHDAGTRRLGAALIAPQEILNVQVQDGLGHLTFSLPVLPVLLHGRRISAASQTRSSPQRCAPDASGSGHRAQPSTHPRERLHRWPR